MEHKWGIRCIEDGELQRLGYRAMNSGAEETCKAVQRELMRRIKSRYNLIRADIPYKVEGQSNRAA